VHWIYHIVRHFLVFWGYWAVLLGLLGESAGLPVPGESTLMFASFLAHKNTGLHLYFIIPVGVAAATGGDNIGFFLGRRFGETLLRWAKKIFRLSDEDIAAAKDLIRRRGATTIFFARFIFGLRTIAGPLAGMLGMEWRRFVLFNCLGAVSWVTAVSLAGYLFANEFNTLLSYIETVSWIIAGGLLAFGYFMWRHKKKKFKQRQQRDQEKAA
jgi:membrane protein DedA with SNARE-associated domain